MPTPRRPRRLWTDSRERLTRTVWPTRAPFEDDTAARVAIVTVSYNTLALTAHLLFSVLRVLPIGSVERIVVVDNGSTDGSSEFLAALAALGLIDLVHNRRSPYHGPGLNRGISHLASLARQDVDPVNLVWVLDSDAVVLMPDALDRCVRSLRSNDAALVGKLQDYDRPRPRLDRYAHPAALLMDPARVWHHRVPAFLEDGAPGVVMQHVLRQRGERVADVPVFADALMLHLGSGTLRRLADSSELDNRYFEWATEHRDHHFHGRADGAALYGRFLRDFTREIPALTPDVFLDACLQTPRLSWAT